MSNQALVHTTPEARAVLATEQARIANIKQAFDLYHRARNGMVSMAYLIGFELNAQKDGMAHGRFTEWCEVNLPEIGEATRVRYMKFAVELQRRHKELGPEARALLLASVDGGDLVRQEAQQKLGDRIYELTDGKSLTELYKDTGVIKPKEKPEPRERKPRVLTAADKAKADQRRAVALFDGLCEGLVALATPASVKALASLPPRELKSLKQRWERLGGEFARKLKAIKD